MFDMIYVYEAALVKDLMTIFPKAKIISEKLNNILMAAECYPEEDKERAKREIEDWIDAIVVGTFPDDYFKNPVEISLIRHKDKESIWLEGYAFKAKFTVLGESCGDYGPLIDFRWLPKWTPKEAA